jgi:hypothetical protein
VQLLTMPPHPAQIAPAAINETIPFMRMLNSLGVMH